MTVFISSAAPWSKGSFCLTKRVCILVGTITIVIVCSKERVLSCCQLWWRERDCWVTALRKNHLNRKGPDLGSALEGCRSQESSGVALKEGISLGRRGACALVSSCFYMKERSSVSVSCLVERWENTNTEDIVGTLMLQSGCSLDFSFEDIELSRKTQSTWMSLTRWSRLCLPGWLT